MLKGDSSGSARLAAADERINRALADAVERHTTKDPGMRGILKRASVVCYPESEPQKKIPLDTEQDSTPHPSVSYGGSSASGAQPSITTSTDQNTGTSVTREVRAGPAQDVTRTSSDDHIGAMSRRGETVQTRTVRDTRARRGQTAEGESHRKGNHVKSATSNQSSTTEQHVPSPRRIFEKTALQERAVAVTTQEALDVYRATITYTPKRTKSGKRSTRQ